MSNASPTMIPPGNRSGDGWSRYFPFELRSWQKIVADSDLSVEAKAMVKSVVSRSRLMRFEKLEVVHELIAHFVDGEMAGRCYSQLVAEFGNPDVTAKLIRRSKIRNRPIMFRAFSIFGWGLLAVVGIYASFAAYFHMGKPQPTVDYLADFNEGIDQTDESELAWPIYRPLWKKHGYSEGGGFNIDELYNRENENGVMIYNGLKRPTDAGWDDAVRRLNEISDLLDGFREARYKPRLGVVLHADRTRYLKEDFEVLFPGQDPDNPGPWIQDGVDEGVAAILEDSALHILLPHIQVMRTAARIFTVDTRLAIEQDDGERVVVNLETMLGVGRHAADSNTLVGSLVGFAVAGIGLDLIEEVLTEHPNFLDDAQLERIQSALENEDLTKWMNIDGERVFVLDTIQRVFTDNGDGDGRITSTGVQVLSYITNSYMTNTPMPQEDERYFKAALFVAAPASLFVVASRKDTTALAEKFLNQYKAQIERPYWETDEDELDIEEFLDKNQHRYFLLANLMPAFEQVRNAMVRNLARHEGVIAAVASQRHFLKYGTWPNSFDQLSPEFVTEFPVDQMNGKFLNVKAEENGVLIYSVGHDLDDDGGRMHVSQTASGFHRRTRHGPHNFVGGASNPADFDADWILWPQADWKSRLPDEVK